MRIVQLKTCNRRNCRWGSASPHADVANTEKSPTARTMRKPHPSATSDRPPTYLTEILHVLGSHELSVPNASLTTRTGPFDSVYGVQREGKFPPNSKSR